VLEREVTEMNDIADDELGYFMGKGKEQLKQGHLNISYPQVLCTLSKGPYYTGPARPSVYEQIC
jgi:hypothetical protein